MIQRNRPRTTDGDFFYSRKRSAAAQYFANELRLLSRGPIDIRGWIVGRREPQAYGHDILGIEAEAHVEQIPETAQQQARCNQEHKRERKLGDHQSAERPRLASRSFRAAAFLPEHVDWIDSGGLQGRSETEEGSGEDRDAEREEQYGPVNRNVIEPGQGRGNHLQQEFPGEKENRQTSDSAEQRKEQALGEQLADEPHSCPAQRLANGHFASSRGGAREQKIRDVDASDEQNQSHRAHHQQQRLPHIADHRFAQRNEMDAPCAFGRIIRGKLFLQRDNECIEPALCGRERESGFEACDGCLKYV